MDSYGNTRRTSAIDYPKPESGLAEWTSKIKAMQRQVDADEETEQRRLEEEIAAARQARLRRSRGGRTADSAELSRAVEQLNIPSSPKDSSSSDRPRDPAERYGHQNEALRKIMGQNSVYVPDPPSSGRSEGVSLASFIGGRATGPRLNKHAAQQDAHDPTQFDQPDTSTPHPIFGKGGIAMPGMVSKKDPGGSGSGLPRPSHDSRKAISDLRAVASALGSGGKPSDDAAARSSYLRQPDEHRRKSTSPTPRSIVGTEDAERYRPSGSPGSTLRAQKSFDRGGIRSVGSGDTERYRHSLIPSPSSTLRPQKSFERGTDRNYGGEDAERYRPSSSPNSRSALQSQKSFERPASLVTPQKSFERPNAGLKPQKSFERSIGGLKSQKSFERPASLSKSSSSSSIPRPIPSPSTPQKVERTPPPQKPSNRHSLYNANKSTPDLRSQKSWSRLNGRPPSPQNSEVRERTIARPKTPVEARATASPSISAKAPLSPAPRPQSYLSTPTMRERTISSPSTATQMFLPKGPVASQPTAKAGAATPMLARPIQPEPRTPSNLPKISPSAVASPAFQKAGPPKDVTPSISRLQGRGFVQSVVKASLDLGTNSAPSSTTTSPPEKPRSAKKGSVLDRWQPQQNQTIASPTPISPVKSNFGTPARRATADPQVTPARSAQNTPNPAPSYLRPAKSPVTLPSEEPLSPRTTARMMEKMGTGSGSLGSATTMFVQRGTAEPVVDELGVKRPSSRGPVQPSSNHSRTSELPAPTGKPLIHPTKDRARKPRKTSGNQSNQPSQKVTSVLWETSVIVEELASTEIEEKDATADNRPALVALNRSNSKIGRLTEQWMGAGPILPKVTQHPSTATSGALKERKPYTGIRHALPGMVKDVPRPITPKRADSWERGLPPPSPRSPTHEYKAPPSPSTGHVRIPSTGSRATVMEVAQAMSEHAAASPIASPVIPSPLQVETSASSGRQELRGSSPRQNLSPGTTEKRKSSYDSFITLPPLKEEATPAQSPANTLSRSDRRSVSVGSMQPIVESALAPPASRPEEECNGLVRIVHDDHPLPAVDVSAMFNRLTSDASPVPHEARTISVEVISVVGSNSTTLTKDENIFYEPEVLAIIHRFKLASSGLVDTYVWGWLGKQSQLGEAEERKLHDLARRYGTVPVVVRQCAEPTHVVKLLGGRLAIRQGTRTHWTAENTAMHLVRAVDDVVFIDEHDLNVKNLCSAFSYCLSLLGTVYVWHGVGSLDQEREAALQYASTIAGDSEIVELTQGENDDNEMFWMVLGDSPFADADYWKWRSVSTTDVQPSIWRVESYKRADALTAVTFWSDEANLAQSVYVVNCIWELFVVVGPNARGERQDIRLALEVANKYAKAVSPQRPYTPTVHILVLPSQVPLDLKLHIRGLDEHSLNLGNIPDHMNLVSSPEASQQLTATSWDRGDLKDHQMLPLGLDISAVSDAS